MVDINQKQHRRYSRNTPQQLRGATLQHYAPALDLNCDSCIDPSAMPCSLLYGYGRAAYDQALCHCRVWLAPRSATAARWWQNQGRCSYG